MGGRRTFILRLRHVRHPVFVRRLISCRNRNQSTPGQQNSTPPTPLLGDCDAVCRYLFVSPSAQGDAWIVDQAGGKGEAHRIRIWKPVHVRVRVDAVVTHVDGSGCRRHRASHMRTQRNPMLRLRLRLAVIERPHAGEGGRVRAVGIGCDWIHVLRDGRHAGRWVGRRARVCHGQPSRPGRWLGVGHVWMAWDRRAAVGRWGWLRGACNRRVNV